nr:uncharacterized protein LOC129386165 [Dermacentor andersoni]
MGPKLSKKKSLSTILKASGSATTPRCEPSVDFGDTRFTLISPLLSPTRASYPRHLSSSSRLSRISTSSLSSLADSDARSFGRQPITLRRMTRTRGYGFEDTTTRSADNRPSMLGDAALFNAFNRTLRLQRLLKGALKEGNKSSRDRHIVRLEACHRCLRTSMIVAQKIATEAPLRLLPNLKRPRQNGRVGVIPT